MNRGKIAALVGASVCIGLLAPGEPSLAAERNCVAEQSGSMSTDDLPAGSSVLECNLSGRTVKSGRIELTIPAPGEGISMEKLYPSGGVSFGIKVSPDGIISYEEESVDDSTSVMTDLSLPAECSQDVFTKKDEYHYETWEWWIGDGSYPAALAYDDFVAVAQPSVRTWRDVTNDCGYIDKVTKLSTAFKGKTSFESDFTFSGGESNCASDRDHVSTIDAGNLDDNGEPPLATECTWSSNRSGSDKILESDIRLNISDFDFTTTPLSSSCSGDFDVRSVLVHELGHSFGLADISEASYPRMTMSGRVSSCDWSARTLGKGEVHIMQLDYCSPDKFNCQALTKD